MRYNHVRRQDSIINLKNVLLVCRRLVDYCFILKRRHQTVTFLLWYFHVFFLVRLFVASINESYPNRACATKKWRAGMDSRKGATNLVHLLPQELSRCELKNDEQRFFT